MTRRHGLQARHWIGGEWMGGGTPAESRDPATGEVIGRYTLAGPVEAERAVATAKRAFELSG